jgi:putative ABC transport system permease protein
VRDLAQEALAGVTQRPVRSALTVLGTVLGVGAFVATLGLTSTAGAQISSRFDALKATEVIVQDGRPSDDDEPVFPTDSEARLKRLDGVRAAGLIWTVSDEHLPVRRSTLPDPEGGDETYLPVMAASPGALTASGAHVAHGRLYDHFHNDRNERVAVLGVVAAQRLGISRVEQQPGIFIGGLAFTVLGTVDAVDRQSDLLLSVIIPDGTADHLLGRQGKDPKTILIATRLGAAQVVGHQAPIALRPNDPERLIALVPPDPKTLRGRVQTDVRSLFLVLAAVSLLVGALGIANMTLVSVLERVGEIGLRRALGATRRHIAAQFLLESAVLGTIGGLVGTCIGIMAVVAVSVTRQWTVVLEPVVTLPAPLIGTLIGLAAGLYPAVKAASVHPIEALGR